MKKVLSVMIFVVLSCSVFGQAWTSIGLKGGYGLGFLYNQSILDDNTYNHLFSGSYNYGAKASLNLGMHSAITVDVMFATMEQKFNYEIGNTKYDNVINWNTIDLALLYSYYRNSAYIEVGPMISLIQDISEVDQLAGISATTDVDPFFEDKYLSMVLGVGSLVYGTGKFNISMGLRFHFGIQDLISEIGQNPDDFAFNFPAPNRRDSSTLSNDPWGSYKSSLPLFGEFIVEMNFGLGYFAETACQNRGAWFSGE